MKRGTALALVLAISLSVLFNGPVSQAKTYKADAGKKYSFTGRLEKIKFGLEGGRLHTGYFLILNKKVKINGEFFETSKEKRIQIVEGSNSLKKKLKKKLGKKVKIRGKLISGITSHYLTNYAVLDAKLVG